MKNISNETKAKLENDLCNFIKCFIITLNNGTKLYFNESDEDLIIDGNNYKTSCGVSENGGLKQYCDISCSTYNIIGFVNDNNITEEDILSGKFDGAEIDSFLIDVDDLASEKIYLNKGFFKEIKYTDGKFIVKIDGLLSLLDKNIGKTFSPTCRACFCDNKCGLNIENYTANGSITTMDSQINFLSSALTSYTDDYFKNGYIKFTSGKDCNDIITVKEFKNGNIVLSTKPLKELGIGDNFVIVAGCDKTIDTCYTRFNNSINFRGEPNIPRTAKVCKFY